MHRERLATVWDMPEPPRVVPKSSMTLGWEIALEDELPELISWLVEGVRENSLTLPITSGFASPHRGRMPLSVV